MPAQASETVVIADPDAVACAIIDPNGNVVNIAHANPATFSPPNGHALRAAGQDATIGGTWDGERFVRPLPPERVVLAADAKIEARRRILTRFPEWKQANMLARDGELQAIQGGTMRDDEGHRLAARDLTAEEAAEHVAIRQAWDWIKSVRRASDALEAMSPIPKDFQADAYWPEISPVTAVAE